MFRQMTLGEVAEVCHGDTDSDATVFTSVSTDSRRIRPGCLFVALPGERFDGHDHVGQARSAGAVAAMIARPVSEALPTVTVPDTLAGLGRMGAHNRQLSEACVIGITGSQGKTTVKEMTGRILQEHAGTFMTQGNLNNAIGVPLSLLEIGPDDRFAVIEMGANAAGEIAYTGALASPDIAHITNVAGTHLEGFGSLEGVSQAKGELWEALRQDGTAVVNLDDRFAPDWIDRIGDRRHVGISANGDEHADYAIVGLQAKGADSAMTLRTPAGEIRLLLPLPGRHNAANALAAAALAMEAGCGVQDVIAGLEKMKPVRGRLSITILPSGVTLLDDSYNASPASFRAAIDVLAGMPGRRIVVAGDMGELGHDAPRLHREVGEYAARHDVDELMTTGTLTREMTDGFGSGACHYESKTELLEALLPRLGRGISILVKGSRSAGMDTLVEELNKREA